MPLLATTASSNTSCHHHLLCTPSHQHSSGLPVRPWNAVRICPAITSHSKDRCAPQTPARFPLCLMLPFALCASLPLLRSRMPWSLQSLYAAVHSSLAVHAAALHAQGYVAEGPDPSDTEQSAVMSDGIEHTKVAFWANSGAKTCCLFGVHVCIGSLSGQTRPAPNTLTTHGHVA